MTKTLDQRLKRTVPLDVALKRTVPLDRLNHALAIRASRLAAHKEQAAADARLIAAAPDLLESLRECADALEAVDRRLRALTGAQPGELGEVVCARAAIAAATGE
jgi:hypothetical protein